MQQSTVNVFTVRKLSFLKVLESVSAMVTPKKLLPVKKKFNLLKKIVSNC